MEFQRMTDFLDSLAGKGIPGCSFALLKDGEKVYEHYTGYADLESGRKIGPDTMFRIYSMTKLFTCVAAMQLYEQGRFLLTDPVSTYLPEFAEMQVLYTKPNAKTELRRAVQPIRVGDLFGMTAGLTYEGDGGDAAREVAGRLARLRQEKPEYTTREMVQALAECPLAFEPNSHWRYSMCHDVLGALIEVLSGERLSEYIARHITEPLGLKDTVFRCDSRTLEKRMAGFYERQADGTQRKLVKQDVYYRPECRVDRGGAGMISTLGDYLTFAQALCDGGTTRTGVRILGEETLRLMRTNRLNEVQRSDFDWTHCRGYGYGLGMRVMMDPDQAGGGNVGEFGWSGMAGTWVMMDPEKRLTAVYMEQASPSLEPYIAPRLRNMIYSCL